jgi:hypothetical protein
MNNEHDRSPNTLFRFGESAICGQFAKGSGYLVIGPNTYLIIRLSTGMIAYELEVVNGY